MRKCEVTSRPAPIVDRKIRFALVGCGRISANHFEALKTPPRDDRARRGV